MRKFLTVLAVLICGVILCAPATFAQEAASPVATAPGVGGQARADAAASASMASVPVVNPPDPHNAGTLAENVRTTALATYPWSTADIWFGRR